MLFKNNEKYKLKDAELANYFFKFVKFPVRFEFGPGAYTPNPNSENAKRVDRPEVVIIPYSELVNDNEEGTAVTWNYTDLPPLSDRQNGGLEFYKNCDGGLKFSGSFTVDEGRADLAYFLVFISKMSAHNKESKRHLIQVDNRVAKAQQVIESKRNRVTVEGLIMGDNMLDFGEISRIAKAMGMTGIDGLDEAIVRVNLGAFVDAREEREKDGYETFLTLSENVYRKETLEAVTKSIDYELSIYNTGIKKWILHNSKGEKVDELCKTVVGKSQAESLRIHALKDDSLAAKLKAAVSEYEIEKGIKAGVTA